MGLGSGDLNVGDEFETDEQSDSDYGFVFRIILLLMVAWMTLLVFNPALMYQFHLSGYFSMSYLFSLSLMASSAMIYMLSSWEAMSYGRLVLELDTQKRRVLIYFGKISKWCAIVIKNSALLSIWIFIIPVLIGLLFELLVIAPMRVSVPPLSRLGFKAYFPQNMETYNMKQFV